MTPKLVKINEMDRVKDLESRCRRLRNPRENHDKLLLKHTFAWAQLLPIGASAE